MAEEKKYIYSFELVHNELKHYLSVDFEQYAEASELEILCKSYLAPERIGNMGYCEVEWHKFGVTSRHLKKIVDWINNPLEGLRVMVYFRDNPQEILGVEADDSVVSAFERACCKEISEIMKNYKNQRETYGQPSARALELGFWHQYLDLNDINCGEKGLQLIANNLPFHSSSDYYKPFPTNTIINGGVIKHYHILLDINKTPQELLEGEISDWFDIDHFAAETCDKLVFIEQRSLPKDKIPLMQTLFVVAVLLLTERDAKCKEERLKPLYQKLSDYIMGYLKDHFEHAFIWGEKDKAHILEQCEGMNYLDFARTDEYLEVIERKKKKAAELIEHEEQTIEQQEEKKNPDYKDTQVRVAKLKEIYKTLRKDLGTKFKGGSQWFYVYKLMADCKIYEDRSYQLFLNDLHSAGVSKNDMPNPVTFTRKYNQLQSDTLYPYWRVKPGGKQATLDEGMGIAQIAYFILYK